MNCPKCGDVLSLDVYENVEVDRCVKCKGVWLDSGELKKIVQTKGETFDYQMIKDTIDNSFASVPKDEIKNQVNCPGCGESMKPVNYDYSSGIILDRCSQCGGIWLDENELAKVQISKEFGDEEFEKNKEKWMELARSAIKDNDFYDDDVDGGFLGLRLLAYKIAKFLR